MTIGNDDLIRAFLADEARRAVAAAPSLDEAVGRLAPRVEGRPSGASQRLIVLLAATLLLVAALGTAIAVGSGILRLPLVIDSEEPSVDLGIFAPVAGQIVYCTDSGLWAVDPNAPSPTPTLVLLEGTADPDGQCASYTEQLGWSSDGTELLFSREDRTHQGALFPTYLYILRADGTETQVDSDDAGMARRSRPTDRASSSPPRVSRQDWACSSSTPKAANRFGSRRGKNRPSRPTGRRSRISPPSGTGATCGWPTRTAATRTRSWRTSRPWPRTASDSVVAGGRPHRDGESSEGHSAIYTFAPDGSDFTEVITGGSGPHWSPDGSQIAYGEAGLSIADADGSNVRTSASGSRVPGIRAIE